MKNFFRFSIVLLLGGLLLPNAIDAKEHPVWHGIRTPVPLTTAGNGYTNWQWLSPLPSGNNLKDIWMFDSVRWVIVGGAGTIMRTTNAGNSWIMQFGAGDQDEIEKVAFIDDSTGYALGEQMIYTHDGGATWMVKSTPQNGRLCGIAFASHDTGFAVGENGTMMRTIDGGETWVNATINNTWCIYEACPINNQLVYALAQDVALNSTGFLLKSTDGGVTWDSSLISATVHIFPRSMSFPDARHGWIVGTNDSYAGLLFSSSDSGRTWTPDNTLYLGSPGYDHYSWFNQSFGCVDFADSLHGTVSGYLHDVSTSDGGVTWKSVYPSDANYDWDWMKDVKYLNSKYFVMTGNADRVYTTSDSGATWTWKTRFLKTDLYQIAATDSAHIYATGDRFNFWHTSDGGNTWQDTILPFLMASPYPPDLNIQAFGMGGYGIILSGTTSNITSDDGATWQTFTDADLGNAKAVAMFGRKAWAVGAGGMILYSSDGGQNWTAQNSGTSRVLTDVKFVDERHGFICTGDSLLRTTNGGGLWEPKSCPPASSAQFVDSLWGYIITDATYRTTDGGENWAVVGPNPGGTVTFADRMVGISVILTGTNIVQRTTDGGVSWQDWETRASQPMYMGICVRSGPGYVAYVSGNGGAVIVAALSPQSEKTWTWTGIDDSSWYNPANWSPASLPQPGDSVVIGPSPHNPIMDAQRDLCTIGSLHILPGGILNIPGVLSRLDVLGDVIIEGTLALDPGAATQIMVGGTWYNQTSDGTRPTPRVAGSHAMPASANQGFLPGISRVVLLGEGTVSGPFHNLTIDTMSNIQSIGNVTVGKQMMVLQDLDLQSHDTLIIGQPEAGMIGGHGMIPRGTIGRSIKTGDTSAYRFESELTTVQFDGTGTNPQSLSMTAYPDSVPVSDSRWQLIPSTYNPVTHTVKLDSIYLFGSYAFGLDKDTHPTIRRVYGTNVVGGEDFKASISLRIDPTDIEARVREISPESAGNCGSGSSHVPIVFCIANSWRSATSVMQVYNGGWNLVSLPLADSNGFSTYFKNTVSSHVFKFNDTSGYVSSDSLYPGSGYWIKLGAAHPVVFQGKISESMGVQLLKGWNLIGTIGIKDVTAANMQFKNPDTVHFISKFFGYNHSYYSTTTLQSGLGYWIKVSGAAELDMNGISTAMPKISGPDVTASLNRLEIEDGAGNSQTLYFGSNPAINSSDYELPPPPPEGIFDARFGSGRMVETYPSTDGNLLQYPILLHSVQNPVSVRCVLQDGTENAAVALANGRGGALLRGTGSIIITDPAISAFNLVIGKSTGQTPKEYALQQNYPNPFNPATMLRYDLPVDAHVRLTIYNVLGQTTATLVDGLQSAGYKSVTWNAVNVPSGLYFYRLDATGVGDTRNSYSRTNKMILVR